MSLRIPTGCVNRLCGVPGLRGRPLAESRSLNPRAQCNQERKFCQGGNACGSTKSCCRVFKLSIPCGRVPPRHSRKNHCAPEISQHSHLNCNTPWPLEVKQAHV